MKVELLADHAEAIPTLSEWYTSEWAPYYGKDGPGDANKDLASRCNRKSIPLGLLALDGDMVSGTVALDLDPLTGKTPSVVALLVRADRRDSGVGTALLCAAEAHAKRLGFRQLFLSTSVLSDFLIRSGWRQGRKVEFLNKERGSIFVRDL